jgi:flagellar hook protein FlgE
LEDNTLSLQGGGLNRGDSLEITLNDGQGNATTQTLTVGENGNWSFDYDVEAYDIENTSIEITQIVHSGWNGIVSNTALDKATVIKDENGVSEGYLTDYSMDSQGQIVAQFTNSHSIPVAKIAVYHFQNDQGLSSLTGNHFQATVNSGEAIFYTDENGNFIQNTAVMSNRLEGSNVNLATALTELIVIQKAFSGNAKSITTSDEMIQNAIQMKR